MKLGRPTIEPQTRKGSVLTIRLSKEERQRINAIAKGQHKKPSHWARDILMEKAPHIDVSSQEGEDRTVPSQP